MRTILLTVALALTLGACTEPGPCVEMDTTAAATAFAACTTSSTAWNGNRPDECRKAAEAVACRKRGS